MPCKLSTVKLLFPLFPMSCILPLSLHFFYILTEGYGLLMLCIITIISDAWSWKIPCQSSKAAIIPILQSYFSLKKTNKKPICIINLYPVSSGYGWRYAILSLYTHLYERFQSIFRLHQNIQIIFANAWIGLNLCYINYTFQMNIQTVTSVAFQFDNF